MFTRSEEVEQDDIFWCSSQVLKKGHLPFHVSVSSFWTYFGVGIHWDRGGNYKLITLQSFFFIWFLLKSFLSKTKWINLPTCNNTVPFSLVFEYVITLTIFSEPVTISSLTSHRIPRVYNKFRVTRATSGYECEPEWRSQYQQLLCESLWDGGL